MNAPRPMVFVVGPDDEVAVELAAVFDYVLINPDGSREGNTTGRFL